MEVLALLGCFVAGYFAISKFFDWRAKKKTEPRLEQRDSYQDSWNPVQRPAAKPQWYTVLGVSELSPVKDIRAAYLAKIQAYHPDRVATLGAELRELAEQKSQEINAAYEMAQKRRGFR